MILDLGDERGLMTINVPQEQQWVVPILNMDAGRGYTLLQMTVSNPTCADTGRLKRLPCVLAKG
jgi:hypothetical protein